MTWSKVNTFDNKAWDFLQNPVLEGEFIEVKTDVGTNKSNMYTLKVDDGSEVQFWGSTVLDNQMKVIETGEQIKIHYLGKAKGKRGQYKNYVVERWIDVDAQKDKQVGELEDEILEPKF